MHGAGTGDKAGETCYRSGEPPIRQPPADESSMSTDPVVRQYSAHPYPEPGVDLDRRVSVNDPGTFWPLYWPDRPRRAGLEILVAGCGTVEAAALARRHPDARVLGIDVSEAALERQRTLAATHGLANLELVALPVERAAELGRTFDFVSVAGVLHHLADPTAGLRALAGVLRKQGVVSAAVYGRHAREGLNAVQATLRAMGLAEGEERARLDTARQVIAALAPHHPAAQWMARTGEHGALDAHLIDAFLPAREVTFDVPGVLAMVEAAGLAFQGWLQNAPYCPDALFVPGSPAHTALERLPEAERWAACARLTAPLDHWFVACRPDRPGRWRVDPEADDLLDWVIGRRYPMGVRHPPVPYDPRDPLQEALYRPIDGRRTVREVLIAAGLQGDYAAQVALARRFIRHLWRKDAIYCVLPG